MARKYSKAASKKVAKTMHERKSGALKRARRFVPWPHKHLHASRLN